MSLHITRPFIVAFAAAISAGTAGATPTTWTFSGTITAEQLGATWVSNNIGKTVTGTLTIDLDLLNNAGGDGKTTNNGAAFLGYPLATSVAVSGNATGGYLNITVGGGPYDHIASSINKASANTWEGVTTYQDIYSIGIDSCQSATFGPCNSIYLTTGMNTDGVHASGIFANSTYDHPDLSFDQRVNWLSTGADNFGVIAGNNVTEYFKLTSVIQSAVPEPNSIALFSLGLSALALMARRRKVY